jgi:hypothetical protein
LKFQERFEVNVLIRSTWKRLQIMFVRSGVSFFQSPSSEVEMVSLTLNLLTTTIVAPPSNASKWQMAFNSAFKGLNHSHVSLSA